MAWHLTRRGGSGAGGGPRTRPHLAQPLGLADAVHPGPADTYPTKDPVADCLQAYATAHQLPVRLGARVVGLRRTEDSDFQVRTADLFWWRIRFGLMRVTASSRLGRRVQARGEFVTGTSRRRLQRAGVRFRPRLVDAGGRTVRFADGGTLEVGAVVWATGYRPGPGRPADRPELLARLRG